MKEMKDMQKGLASADKEKRERKAAQADSEMKSIKVDPSNKEFKKSKFKSAFGTRPVERDAESAADMGDPSQVAVATNLPATNIFGEAAESDAESEDLKDAYDPFHPTCCDGNCGFKTCK